MILTDEQVDFIEIDLKIRGIALEDFRHSMLDHVCCLIEASEMDEFDKAYEQALLGFGNEEMLEVQEDIVKYNFNKIWKRRNMITYILGFIAIFLLITGSLFKVMHWPGAGMSLVVGALLLNVGFLPLFFYYRYKKSTMDYQ